MNTLLWKIATLELIYLSNMVMFRSYVNVYGIEQDKYLAVEQVQGSKTYPNGLGCWCQFLKQFGCRMMNTFDWATLLDSSQCNNA